MKRSFLAVALLLGGCTSVVHAPTPPGPTPKPPSSTKYDELLLGRNGRVFTDAAGKPFDLQVNASCCFSEDPEPDPEWAFASHAFMDRTASYGQNGIHVRMGPFIAQPDFPPTLVANGGPYLPRVGQGKVDLTQWNPAFWGYVDEMISYGGSKGIRFEIDLIDGWGVKYQKRDPNKYQGMNPFNWNIQGIDAITPIGLAAIVSGSVHDAWLRKIVDVTGIYGNVFYQVGNENEQVPGMTRAWEDSVCDVVHDEEARRGFKRHLCGSNSPSLTHDDAHIDYLTVHNGAPLDQSQCIDATRPCRNNEYNPGVTYTPAQMHSFFCNSKANGTYWDFWRHDMHYVEAVAAWKLNQAGCGTAVPVGCIDIPDTDAVQVLPKPADMYADSVNAALRRLHPECEVNSNCPINEPMQQFLQEFAAEVRKGDATHPPLCAGIQSTPEGPVDEVCVGTKQKCQGNHVFACKAGCTTGTISYGPGSYTRASDTWKLPGTPD